MRQLRRMVNKASREPMIRGLAIRILRSYLVPAREFQQQAEAIQGWVQSNVLYVNEPGDMFVDPIRTLLWGGGDCDDHTTLTASLLESIRIPTKLAILQRNGRSVHVFPKVGLPPRNPRRWIPVETTYPVGFGWNPATADPEVLRRMT